MDDFACITALGEPSETFGTRKGEGIRGLPQNRAGQKDGHDEGGGFHEVLDENYSKPVTGESRNTSYLCLRAGDKPA